MDRRILVVGLVMVAMVAARPSAKKNFKHALKSKGKPDLQTLKEQILADIAAGNSEPVTIEELDLTIGAYRTGICDAVTRFQAIREASPGVAIVTKLRDIAGDFTSDDDEIIRLLYRSFILGFNNKEICKPNTKEYDTCRDGQLQAIVKDMLAVWKVLFPKIMQTCDALDKLVEAKEDVSDKAINGAFKKDIGCLKNQYQSVDEYLKSIADSK